MADKCWVCLNCGAWERDDGKEKAPFCGDCGTKMIAGFVDPDTGRPYGAQEKPKQEPEDDFVYHGKVDYTPPPAYTYEQKRPSLKCPKCGSDRINVAPVTDVWTQHRGCIGWCLWILLTLCTCGLMIIIPLITNSKTKSKTHSEAVCQNCGHHWQV